MPEELIHSTLPPGEKRRKGVLGKLGLNGCAVIFQAVLIAVVATATVAGRQAGTSVVSTGVARAGAAAAIVLAVTLPFCTFAVLLRLRRRLGAGRTPDPPRKMCIFDLLALTMCVVLLLIPLALVALNALRHG